MIDDHLDLLVVNHARSGHGRLADVTAPELDAFLQRNVRAAILLVKSSPPSTTAVPVAESS